MYVIIRCVLYIMIMAKKWIEIAINTTQFFGYIQGCCMLLWGIAALPYIYTYIICTDFDFPKMNSMMLLNNHNYNRAWDDDDAERPVFLQKCIFLICGISLVTFRKYRIGDSDTAVNQMVSLTFSISFMYLDIIYLSNLKSWLRNASQ